MKLRDLPGELEAALSRLMQKPEARRPALVVSAQSKESGVFIQYSGSAERALTIGVCFNVVTREIPGFEAAAHAYFGGPMRIAEDETYGSWDKECPSVVRAVEHGMFILRSVLLVDWGAEMFIEEIEDESIDRVRRGIVFGGLG